MQGVLSYREREVVNAVARGASYREVAARLFISHRTVESHLRRIYLRIGLDGSDDLVDLVSRSASLPQDVARPNRCRP